MDAVHAVLRFELQRRVPGSLGDSECLGDDLLFLLRQGRRADLAFSIKLESAEALQVPLSLEKCCSPRRVPTFLGFCFALDAGTVTVPREKWISCSAPWTLCFRRPEFGCARPRARWDSCPPARLLLNSFTDALRGRDRHD